MPCFAKGIADGVKNIRAMTSLNLSDNDLGAEGAKNVAEAIKIHVSVLRFVWYNFELYLSSGLTTVVYGYSYYNTTKGALASLNISNNNIGEPMLPEGWSDKGNSFTYRYVDAAGETCSMGTIPP